MRSQIILLLIFSYTSGFSQPQGYYFKDIKGTSWVSSGYIKDMTILNENEIGLSIIKSPILDSLQKTIWLFSDSLTLKYYDITSNNYKTLFACMYFNDEKDKTISFQLNNGTEMKFEYNSVSTGSYVVLRREKK